jgi:hypothetical protein
VNLRALNLSEMSELEEALRASQEKHGFGWEVTSRRAEDLIAQLIALRTRRWMQAELDRISELPGNRKNRNLIENLWFKLYL